jgi:hypothetical protein
MGREERQEYLNAWKTFGSLLVTSPPFRRYLRGLRPPRSALHMFDYLGYGVFVGRKSATDTQTREATDDRGTEPGDTSLLQERKDSTNSGSAPSYRAEAPDSGLGQRL